MVILRTASGDYVGHECLNSDRDYAKLFNSEEEAREYAIEQRIYSDFKAEAA